MNEELWQTFRPSPYVTDPYRYSVTIDGKGFWYKDFASYGDVSTVTLSMNDYYKLKEEQRKELINSMNIKTEKLYRERGYLVYCSDMEDLSIGRVLKTLSAMKGKLMLETAPNSIRKIECNMTPEVRKNIITASKKLRMYGKKRPIIATFDEYGNRLPDEMNLEDTNGILLNILDPDIHGTHYLNMKALEFDNADSTIHNMEVLEFGNADSTIHTVSRDTFYGPDYDSGVWTSWEDSPF